ncbi:hypothetical protein [Kitasatospora sp. MBT63]|uniref:hypothetical protein n=1 Tax=Kitasatospora sp. MBT63 TaxID=1444768 RepID=UPI00053B7A3D|nr:hypothetical protein [Kitasatospora sp. MBT63]
MADADIDTGGHAPPGPGLAELLLAAAAVMERAGELVPLAVTLRPATSTIQLTGTSAAPMADQRVSIDRLEASLPADDPAFRQIVGRRHSYGIKAELPGGIRLLAFAVTPWQTRPDPDDRTTTTRSSAAMLRELAPWAATVDAGLVDELTVADLGRGHATHLILHDSADPLRAVEAVTADLPARVERRPMGAAARAMLPTGHYLRVVADHAPAPAARAGPATAARPEPVNAADRVADLAAHAARLREQRNTPAPPAATPPLPPVHRPATDTHQQHRHGQHRRDPPPGARPG